MNQQRLQQEPSMEEILASIRRIISEDEAASNKSRAPTGPTMPASANGTPGGGGAPTRRADDAPSVRGNVFSNHKGTAELNGGQQNGSSAHALAGGEGKPPGVAAPTYATADFSKRDYDQDYGEDAVLDLTEMVAEDGSVVTIAPVSADGQGDEGDGGANFGEGGAYNDTLYPDSNGYPAEYGDPAQGDGAAEADYTQWNEDRDGQQEGPQDRSTLVLKDGASDVESPEAYMASDQDAYDDYTASEPDAAAAGVRAEEPRKTARVEVAHRGDPRTVPAARTSVRLNTALAALAGGDAGQGAESDQGAGDARSDAPVDTYDAAPEAEIAAGPYDDDAQAAADAAHGATAEYLESSALEEMIRETMKPMLREWLDSNLTRLVEDVAREELHRMIESRGGL